MSRRKGTEATKKYTAFVLSLPSSLFIGPPKKDKSQILAEKVAPCTFGLYCMIFFHAVHTTQFI